MIQLLTAARLLLLDLASTVLFLLLFVLTGNVALAVAGAMASASRRSGGSSSGGNRSIRCNG